MTEKQDKKYPIYMMEIAQRVFHILPWKRYQSVMADALFVRSIDIMIQDN